MPVSFFETDFSEDTLGAPPSGFTVWLRPGNAELNVIGGGRFKYLQFRNTYSYQPADVFAAKIDDLGDEAEQIEILAKTDGWSSNEGFYFFGGGGAGYATMYALYIYWQDSTLPQLASVKTQIVLYRVEEANLPWTWDQIGSAEIPAEIRGRFNSKEFPSFSGSKGWRWVRIRAVGNCIQCRTWCVWEPEPNYWQLEAWDWGFTSGHVGFWSHNYFPAGYGTSIRYLAAATDGRAIFVPDAETTPTGLIFMDGFDRYAVRTYQDNSGIPMSDVWISILNTSYSQFSLTPLNSTDVRAESGFDSRKAISGIATAQDSPFLGYQETLIVGVAVKVTIWPETSGQLLAFLAHKEIQVGIGITPNGAICAYRGAAPSGILLGVSDNAVFPENKWIYLEARVSIHPSAGTIDVWLTIDGVESRVLALVGQNTRSVSFDFCNRIRLQGCGQLTCFDDFYVDTATRHGDVSIVFANPKEDATYKQWSVSGATTRYGAVTGVVVSKYTYTPTIGNKDSFKVTNASFGLGGSTVAIQLTATVLDADPTWEFRFLVRQSGTDYFSNPQWGSSVFGMKIYKVDPSDAEEWTKEKLLSAEYGYELYSRDPDAKWNNIYRIYAFNVEVMRSGDTYSRSGWELLQDLGEGEAYFYGGAAANLSSQVLIACGESYTYAGSGIIVRSTDDGETWSAQFTAPEFSCIAFDGSVWIMGILWSGPYYGVWKSIDDGETWTPKMSTVYVDGVPQTFEDDVLSVACGEGTWLAAATYENSNVYRSVDGGETWHLVNNSPYLDLIYYAAGMWLGITKKYYSTPNQIWLSVNGGLTWEQQSFDPTYVTLFCSAGWNGTRWVIQASGEYGFKVGTKLISPDGVNWVSVPSVTEGEWGYLDPMYYGDRVLELSIIYRQIDGIWYRDWRGLPVNNPAGGEVVVANSAGYGRLLLTNWDSYPVHIQVYGTLHPLVSDILSPSLSPSLALIAIEDVIVEFLYGAMQPRIHIMT